MDSSSSGGSMTLISKVHFESKYSMVVSKNVLTTTGIAFCARNTPCFVEGSMSTQGILFQKPFVAEKGGHYIRPGIHFAYFPLSPTYDAGILVS